MTVAKRTHPGPKRREIAAQGHFSGTDALGYLKGRKIRREAPFWTAGQGVLDSFEEEKCIKSAHFGE